MNEGGHDNAPVGDQENLKNNFTQFQELNKQYNLNEEGSKWYVERIGHLIDFSKVFRYLRLHPEDVHFDGIAGDIVNAQIELQSISASLYERGVTTLSSHELEHMQELCERLRATCDRFGWEASSEDIDHIRGTFIGLQEQVNATKNLDQQDRLIELTRTRREAMGYTHAEAKEISEDFKNARNEITKIKNRLKKLLEGTATEEDQKEIVKLRSELAHHLQAVRKEFPIESKEIEEAQPEEVTDNVTIQTEDATELAPTINSPIDQLAHLSPQERIDAQNWRGLSDALINKPTLGNQQRADNPEQMLIEHNDRPNTIDDYLHIRRRIDEYTQRLREKIATDPTSENSQEYQNGVHAIALLLSELNREHRLDFDREVVNSAASAFEQNISALEVGVTTPTSNESTPASQEASDGEPTPKEYEHRREMLREWREKKDTYESMYATYLNDRKFHKENTSAFQKMQFWKKESKPQELIEAEVAYRESRAHYASVLDSALGRRLGREGLSSTTEKAENYKALMANNFVIQPAYKRLETEKHYIAENMLAQKLFSKLSQTYKKHSKTIRVVGYVTTFGIAAASGAGFAGVVLALAGKVARAKVGVIGGAATGVLADATYNRLVLKPATVRMESAAQLARHSYNVDGMEELDKRFLQVHYHYDAADKNRKFVVGATAFAGGIAAGGLAGALNPEHVLNNLSSHDILKTPVSRPVVSPEVHSGDSSILTHEVQHEVTHLQISNPETIVQSQDMTPLLSREQLERQLNSAPAVPEQMIPAHAPVIEPVVPEAPSSPAPLPPVPESRPEPRVPVPQWSPKPIIGVPNYSMPRPHELLYTFELGNSINTLSEALYEKWKENPQLLNLEAHLSRRDFIAHMYATIEHMRTDASFNQELLNQMDVTSGNVDKVQVGQTVDLEPFFEYINSHH